MKKFIVVMVAAAVGVGAGFKPTPAQDAAEDAQYRWEDASRGMTAIRAVAAAGSGVPCLAAKPGAGGKSAPAAPAIFIGTAGGVFRNDGAGIGGGGFETRPYWRPLLSGMRVNALAVNPWDDRQIYAATSRGLYFSANAGRTWTRIFRGKNEPENECTAAAVLPHGIYLGTSGGFFISHDCGSSWRKAAGDLGRNAITGFGWSARNPENVFVSSAAGIFRSGDAGHTWERVMRIRARSHDESAEGGAGSGTETEQEPPVVSSVSCDPDNDAVVYASTSTGVYKSSDRGASWEVMPEHGLSGGSPHLLFTASGPRLYAAHRAGFFVYGGGRWHDASAGIAMGEIHGIAEDSSRRVYVAADRGLFFASFVGAGLAPALNGATARVAPTHTDGTQTVQASGVPSIRDIQQAAVRYAEVEPEKILSWRRKAAQRAWLPRMTLGADKESGDLWHWESGSTTKADDDILRRGRASVDWSISLSWDLSDLIWTSEQTSIDSRSRLMVELRNDIIDTVTKIYYERLRQQHELESIGIEDARHRFDKELKIQELTAELDAYTGGYFSGTVQP